MTEEERLLKLELTLPAIKDSLAKMLEGQEALTALKLESEASKTFRNTYETMVRNLVRQELNTKGFEREIKKQIEEEVVIIFNKPEVRQDLLNTIDERIELKWKDRKIGWVSAIVSAGVGIAVGLIGYWARGVIG